MCGIAGFAGLGITAVHTDARVRLEKMSQTLAHRGPDDAGIWEEEGHLCGLAHRRLAIVDLSPGGRQPMESCCGRYVVVFNGEIYNHRELRAKLESIARPRNWSGTSDTESLLEAIAAWGLKLALERADGMFALAVWDRWERTLSLARDRVGEKPLFYRHANGYLAFASEMKALLALPDEPRTIDRQGLIAYLNFGYVCGAGSMIAGVGRVMPATVVRYEVDHDRLRQEKYWQVPALELEKPAGEEELTDLLEQKLARAVKMQMQADVPVAILLSGGLDSSLVTAFAAGAKDKVRTFTIGFPNGGRYDERAHAKLVAQHFGTDHTEILLESTALDAVERISRLQDEPLCDSSMLPMFLICEAARRHVKVALGGDGGDELFGGYRAYNVALLQQLVRLAVPRSTRKAIADFARRHTPLGMKGRSYLTALGCTSTEAAARSLVLYDLDSRRGLLRSEFLMEGFSPESLKSAFLPAGLSVIQTVTLMDFHTHLPDDILVKVDRAAMMSSLEVRAPMLDRQVVEFIFGRVPDDLKAGYRRRKILLRKLAGRRLPPELDVRRKQGFSIPLDTWFNTGKATVLLDAAKALPHKMVDPQYVDTLIAAQRGGANHAERIYCLAMLSFWLNHYKIRIG